MIPNMLPLPRELFNIHSTVVLKTNVPGKVPTNLRRFKTLFAVIDTSIEFGARTIGFFVEVSDTQGVTFSEELDSALSYYNSIRCKTNDEADDPIAVIGQCREEQRVRREVESGFGGLKDLRATTKEEYERATR